MSRLSSVGCQSFADFQRGRDFTMSGKDSRPTKADLKTV